MRPDPVRHRSTKPGPSRACASTAVVRASWSSSAGPSLATSSIRPGTPATPIIFERACVLDRAAPVACTDASERTPVEVRCGFSF